MISDLGGQGDLAPLHDVTGLSSRCNKLGGGSIVHRVIIVDGAGETNYSVVSFGSSSRCYKDLKRLTIELVAKYNRRKREGGAMKVKEVFQPSREEMLPQTQKKILSFFRKFSDEVFPYAEYWSPELLQEVNNMKVSTIDWCIWALQQAGFLDKEKVGRRTYFGLPEAINLLREEKYKREMKK